MPFNLTTVRPSAAASHGKESKLEVLASRHFTAWMTERCSSLAFTTYQSNKVFFLGVRPDGQLSVFERTFGRCMGLWSDGQTLWMSSQFQLWHFENVLQPGDSHDGYDRLYVPRIGYTTGDLDIHDLAIDSQGQPVFVNTLFGCLATVSPRFNFQSLWKPPFLSKLAAEDRCHLNGLAMEPSTGDSESVKQQGRARYVTACSQSDAGDGWRDQRRDGGCVIDVTTNEVVATGFCMPHSPRLFRDRLWLLDSGNGYFGYVDLKSGKFERVAFCPGYARGLTLVGRYAVVGLSRPREQTFRGLPLDDQLAERKASARCGLQVIDLESGDVVHWLRIEGKVEELYDVVVLPGVVRPKALGFKTDEIRHNVWFENEGEGKGKTDRWSASEATSEEHRP